MPDRRCCVACGGNLEPLHPQVVDPQSDDLYAVMLCADCGLGHTDPIPEDIGSTYGDIYYGEQRHGITGRVRAWLRARYVERHAGKVGTLLDAGCGTGEFLALMSRRGWKVGGTELDHRTRQLASSGIDVRPALDEWAGGAPIDVITMWHSLEHVVDPKSQIEAAHRLLVPCGSLVVAVPDVGGLEAKVFGRFGFGLDVPRHLYHFDLASLTRLLDRAGFTVEAVGHQEFEYDVVCWLQSALNACVEPPNALFNWIIGRPLHKTGAELAVSLVLGAVLLPPALVAAAISVAVRRGSIMKVVARKRA